MPRNRPVAPAKESKVSIAEAKHMMRFLRSERGEKPEDIARQEGVSLDVVEKSIRKVQIQKAIFTSDNSMETLRKLVVQNASHASNALANALTAKKYVTKNKTGKDGKVKTVFETTPDTLVQLEGLKAYKGLAEVIQPKSGGINVNVKQNNQTALVTNLKGNGYEERMDAIRQRAAEFNSLPGRVIASVSENDEEIIDAEEDGDDEEEDE